MSETSTFARPISLRGVSGKCTASLKAMVPEAAKEDFIDKSRALGYGEVSDCLRDIIFCWLYSVDEVAKVQAERLRMLATTGPESDR